MPSLCDPSPEVLELVRNVLGGVAWGGGAIVLAFCVKMGGPGLAKIIAAMRGKLES